MKRMQKWAQKQTGFTIVELLIVIVVIAILAGVTIAAYNGVQERSRQTKITNDIRNLEQAIIAARNNNGGVALRYITLSTATGSNCWSKPTDTDLAALPSTDGCWTAYNAALARISDASGINVRGLIDPWGRPYYMDENEGEGADPPTACNPDAIGYYAQPFTTAQTMIKSRFIPKIQPRCL
jgi:prepilin-type N-terminal cleavage/methylation domain-containing protein